MGVIGFNFTKISAQRNEGKGTQVNIKNNISIKNVEEEKTPITGKDQSSLKVEFEFSSIYEPDLGNISIHATVLALESKEEGAKNIKEWKEKKKLPDNFMRHTFNFMLRRCNIKALVLAEDLNLPSPIQLPKLQSKKVEEDEE